MGQVGPKAWGTGNAGEPTRPGAWGPDPRCPPPTPALPARPFHTATSSRGVWPAVLLSTGEENTVVAHPSPVRPPVPPQSEAEPEEIGTGTLR